MEILPNSKKYEFLLQKFISLLKYQYKISIDKIKTIDLNKLSFTISKRTGRLKYIKYNNILIATFRYQDGYLIFTKYGLKFALNLIPYPENRVVIPKRVSKFIAEGKSLFSKHIITIDPELRPESEVIIVDQDDNPVALGKLLMSIKDIKYFKSGVAVKVR